MLTGAYQIGADASGTAWLEFLKPVPGIQCTAADTSGPRIKDMTVIFHQSARILTEQDHTLLMAALFRSSELLYEF